MAAHCWRSTLQAFHRLSNKTLWRGPHLQERVCHLRLQENGLHSRALYCRHYTLQTNSRTESPKVMNTQKAAERENNANQHKKEEEVDEEEEEDNRPEYIPKRRAKKHSMRKVAYAWMIGLPAGIIGFMLTKRQVEKNRHKQMKIRQKMMRGIEGD